jgi:hypothetical protein
MLKLYLAWLLLMGLAVFLCIVLVFRLGNYDWPFGEDD